MQAGGQGFDPPPLHLQVPGQAALFAALAQRSGRGSDVVLPPFQVVGAPDISRQFICKSFLLKLLQRNPTSGLVVAFNCRRPLTPRVPCVSVACWP